MLCVLFFYPLGADPAGIADRRGARAVLRHYAAVFGTALFRGALLHTVAIALASSAGCLVLGFVLALILSFVPFPGARIVSRLIDTFIALPTFLVALAFTFIYGSAGLLNAVADGAAASAAAAGRLPVFAPGA